MFLLWASLDTPRNTFRNRRPRRFSRLRSIFVSSIAYGQNPLSLKYVCCDPVGKGLRGCEPWMTACSILVLKFPSTHPTPYTFPFPLGAVLTDAGNFSEARNIFASCSDVGWWRVVASAFFFFNSGSRPGSVLILFSSSLLDQDACISSVRCRRLVSFSSVRRRSSSVVRGSGSVHSSLK